MAPDAEVRIAHQPHYPFEYSIQEIIQVDLSRDPEDQDEDLDLPPEINAEYSDGLGQWIVYIAEGSQLGYLPEIASNELGWR